MSWGLCALNAADSDMAQAGKRLLAGNVYQVLKKAQGMLQGCNPSVSNRSCKRSQKSPCCVHLCHAMESGYSHWFGPENLTQFSGCSCSKCGRDLNLASLILLVSGSFQMASVLRKDLEGIKTSLPGRKEAEAPCCLSCRLETAQKCSLVQDCENGCSV